MSTSPKVLLFSDNSIGRRISIPALEDGGLTCFAASDEEAAVRLVRDVRPDLLLVNSYAPSKSLGESMTRLKGAKCTRNLPTLLVCQRELVRPAASSFEIEDSIHADICDLDLTLRIKAVLRREKPEAMPEKLSFKDLHVDMTSHRVIFSDGPLMVSPQILRLLITFVERPDKTWARQELMDWVWGTNADLGARSIDMLVSRGRKTLNGRTDVKILSVRGLGYRIS